MGLFERPIGGDPSRGEQAVLAALNSDRFDDARRTLERDPAIRPDFRELVEDHLRKAIERAGKVKSWNVTLPLPVWDEYARQARLAKLPISEILAAAVQRDFDRQRETLSPVETLDHSVRAYHRAAGEVMDEVRQLAARVGPLQDLSVRLGRIEASLAARR